MDLYQFKKDLLKTYGISRKSGNDALTKTYSAIAKNISNHGTEIIEEFDQLLRACGFTKHAEKLQRLYGRSIDEKKPILKDDLTIEAICKSYVGRTRGCSILSLGERIVNQGSGWMVTEPIRAVVVKGFGFKLGERLPKLPEGAVSVKTFFEKNIRKRRTL
jgi:hypothetical protein